MLSSQDVENHSRKKVHMGFLILSSVLDYIKLTSSLGLVRLSQYVNVSISPSSSTLWSVQFSVMTDNDQKFSLT